MNNIAGQIIALLFIIMFSYAAVSKVLDHDVFLMQLRRSEFLTNYAVIISWAIPFIELAACVMLAVPAWKLQGLYIAYGMMFLFTGYIILILQLAEHVPCSCGGILEQMTWGQHLVFNIAFLVLSVYEIITFYGPIQEESRTPAKK